jgi:hypothetical protein
VWGGGGWVGGWEGGGLGGWVEGWAYGWVGGWVLWSSTVYVMVMLSQSRWTVSSRGQVGPGRAGPGRAGPGRVMVLTGPGLTPPPLPPLPPGQGLKSCRLPPSYATRPGPRRSISPALPLRLLPGPPECKGAE